MHSKLLRPTCVPGCWCPPTPTHQWPQPAKKPTAPPHAPPYTVLPAASSVKSSNMAAMVELGWWMEAIWGRGRRGKCPGQGGQVGEVHGR